MSGDPENQYLADGIADEITGALARLGGLRVAARTSAFSFRGKGEDVRTVGEKLGVATVLEGSVRRAGDRLRVTAQLIDAADGYHLWSGRYDRELTDLFAVQEEIATAIAGTLEVTLGARSAGMLRPPTADVEAFRLYHKGLSLLRRRGHAAREAVACFEQAIARDDRFAQAHAALSEALAAMGFWGGAPGRTIVGRARAAAARAMALAPDDTDAHTAAAYLATWYDRDAGAAGEAFARALALDPGETRARAAHAMFVLAGARADYCTAATEAEHAASHDPLSAYAWAMVANVYTVCGRYEESIAPAERAIALDPASFIAHVGLPFAYEFTGRHERALEAARQALAVSGRHPWSLAALAICHGRAGERDLADAVLAELRARAVHDWVAPTDLAMAAVGAGRIDEALVHVARAVEELDPRVVTIDFEHWIHWNPLRTDPRFPALRERLGWERWAAR
jgi:serine/threonine-protein kinase